FKLNEFYKKMFLEREKTKFKEIRNQCEFARLTKQFSVYAETFEMALKENFKNINLIQKFVEENNKAIEKVISKFEKYVEHFYNIQEEKKKEKEGKEEEIKKEKGNEEYEEKEAEIPPPNVLREHYNKLLEEQAKELKGAAKELEKYIDLIHETFAYYFSSKSPANESEVDTVYTKYDNPYNELIRYLDYTDISVYQGFWLGLLIGLLFFLLLMAVLIILNYDLDIDLDPEFNSVFPNFRSFFVVCLYFWFTGFVIWSWRKVGINYRLIFQITGTTIKPIEIYKQAAFFSFFFMFCFILYCLERAQINVFFGYYIPVDMLPLFFWGLFFFIIFYPGDYFKYETRQFIFDLLTESMTCWLTRPAFRNSWFIGNMTSFIGPARDLEYSICYYAYYQASTADKQYFCSKSRGIYLAIAFFPHIIKVLTVFREISIQTKTAKKKEEDKINSKKELRSKETDKAKIEQLDKEIKTLEDKRTKFYVIKLAQALGLLKHTFSFCTSTLSFFTKTHPWCFYPWICITIPSAILSFSMDIKKDFALLDTKNDNAYFPLRKRRLFPRFSYYAISMIDIVLRFGWLVNLSPEIVGQLLRPNTVSLILFSLEIFRRSLWNLIRVEVKHLETSRDFLISPPIELPFVENPEYGWYELNEDADIMTLMNMTREEVMAYQVHNMFQEGSKCCFNRDALVLTYAPEDRVLPDKKKEANITDILKKYWKMKEQNLINEKIQYTMVEERRKLIKKNLKDLEDDK
ncbi:MAG: ERD1 family protein, partial [archaeon]|nr:ERD1 family protein [archaeon]